VANSDRVLIFRKQTKNNYDGFVFDQPMFLVNFITSDIKFIQMTDPQRLLPSGMWNTFQSRQFILVNSLIWILDNHKNPQGKIANVIYQSNSKGEICKKTLLTPLFIDSYAVAADFKYLYMVGGYETTYFDDGSI
jgi:hypothetical protein